MKTKTILTILLICMINSQVYAVHRTLTTYPAPQGAELNDEFSVNVRQGNGQWQLSPSYLVKVDKLTGTNHIVTSSSVSSFDFNGVVEVKVAYNKGEIKTARIRPLSYGITPRIEGNSLFFTLKKSCNISVEVNGDIYHNIQIFANPIETAIFKKSTKDVIYFGAGIHSCKGEGWKIPSGKTVYVAGGAVLKNRLIIDSVNNVKVLGRGIIDYSVKEGIQIRHSRNISVDGLLMTQIPIGNSTHVKISNVKVISYYGWGDGMNVFACNDVNYDHVFCRTSDDCTTVYATRKGFVGGASNIRMRDAVLWADVAHPIFIGLHGNPEHPDTIQNLRYTDIDILEQNEPQIDYQGCMAIGAGDNNVVRDIIFDSIRVENIRNGQLINIRTTFNKKYCGAPGRHISNISFNNISYNGEKPNISIISAFDAQHPIDSIHFRNFNINGNIISDDMNNKPKFYKTSDMCNMYIGENVNNVTFDK
jgi:hypothetical protein